ncbi:MAG: hypothetical protein LBP62_01435 [Clostridiales bacterium]|nr:hypothetical protein [Clostridiales bacterium]
MIESVLRVVFLSGRPTPLIPSHGGECEDREPLSVNNRRRRPLSTDRRLPTANR